MIPEAALLIAGFALAHATWSVSDLPKTELLCPLAIVDAHGNRQLTRFEAESQEKAIAAGKAAYAEWSANSDGWAFAREGLIREPGGPVDVISVDFWAVGMPRPQTIIQHFRRANSSGGFKVLGPPELVIDGTIQTASQAQRGVNEVMKGVMLHAKVAPLWSTWQ